MTQLLASVRTMEEALLASVAGADIIDLKAPERGSLGALSIGEIERIAGALRGQKPISATIGDLPMIPGIVTEAVSAAFEAGVDYVKVGFFPGGDERGTVQALKAFTEQGHRLVAVLFADQNPSLTRPSHLSDAGFAGCMLDTFDKQRGSLTRVYPFDVLSRFVAEVHAAGLLCGLAGSLTLADVPELLPLKPDYLGFRGALCRDQRRTHRLDSEQLRRIRAAIDRPVPADLATDDEAAAGLTQNANVRSDELLEMT